VFRINLLPEEARPQMRGGLRVRRGMLLTLASLGIVLVSVVGTASWQARSISRLETQAVDLRAEAERYAPQIHLVKQLRSKKSDLEKRLGVIHQLDENRGLRIAVMDDLSSALPEYVWLTSFLESESTITVEGAAFSSLAVFEFMVDLESMPRFAGVELSNLKRASQGEDEVTRFTLKTRLVGG